MAVERQKLIYSGKVLKDSARVGELGIGDSDFIVCMVSKETAKPKPAPTASAATVPAAAITTSPAVATATNTPAAAAAPAVPPPVTEAAAAPATSPGVTSTPLANPAATTPAVGAATTPDVDATALANLVAMGFPENECRAALRAANGNGDLAVEFLMGGIPPGALRAAEARTAAAMNQDSRAAATTGTGVAALEAFRQHPQFNQLKQLVQQNPAAISQVMDAIGRQNQTLLEAIHANHDAFVAMMNEPITDTPPPPPASGAAGGAPINAPAEGGLAGHPAAGGGGAPSPAQLMQLLAVLPPEQRLQLAQSMGLSQDQLHGVMQMMASMPPEQLQQLTAAVGGGGGFGGNVIRLTDDELQSVNRLMELGFSQQQAAQAFLACEKNEALAANLLLEGGWGGDGEGDVDLDEDDGGEGSGDEDEDQNY